MSCNKCGTSNKNCGCSDSPYTTVKTYTCPEDAQCPKQSPCPEYGDSACILYQGASIYDLGIEEGRSLQSIIQQLTILTGATPACADPCSTCQSTWNVYPISTTSSTITLGWDASATAVSYQIEYQELPEDPCTLGTWTLVTSQTTLMNTIGNLTADTYYLFRVNSICASGNCYSVILKIKTEA